MLEKLRIIFTIPELRSKIFLTLFLLAIYRVGWQIPLPIVDQEKITQFATSTGGSVLGDFMNRVSVFSGSNLSQATVFGLGIMPYISAAIIFQLLGTVYKPLEDLKKEGEAGRKKLNEYTRYLTVLLCLIQSAGFLWFFIMGRGLVADQFLNDADQLGIGWQLTAILIMTCGSIFLMWIGEQIDEYGIGNGISLLIMAGIVAMMPSALTNLLRNAQFRLTNLTSGEVGLEKMIVLVLMFVGVTAGVVFITLAQRRIPTQSAKHVRGRRVYGGTRQYMPLRINQAGVMPIIFASSLLMLPPFLLTWLGGLGNNWFSNIVSNIGQSLQNPLSMVYNLV
ncbi:MAG: preprotein translocase subunit SecY, partial [Planctomycetota bacterium]